MTRLNEKDAARQYLAAWRWALDSDQCTELQSFLRFFKIEAIDGRFATFEFWGTQAVIAATIADLEARGLPVRIIILKARQQGCSTLIAGYFFSKALREEGAKCIIMADD